MSNEYKQKIAELQEKIHELKEYLYSDICKNCGETAIKLEEYLKELAILVSRYIDN